MDLGTIIGLVLIIALLAGAMSLGVGVGPYIDVPSVLIVIASVLSVNVWNTGKDITYKSDELI